MIKQNRRKKKIKEKKVPYLARPSTRFVDKLREINEYARKKPKKYRQEITSFRYFSKVCSGLFLYLGHLTLLALWYSVSLAKAYFFEQWTHIFDLSFDFKKLSFIFVYMVGYSRDILEDVFYQVPQSGYYTELYVNIREESCNRFLSILDYYGDFFTDPDFFCIGIAYFFLFFVRLLFGNMFVYTSEPLMKGPFVYTLPYNQPLDFTSFHVVSTDIPFRGVVHGYYGVINPFMGVTAFFLSIVFFIILMWLLYNKIRDYLRRRRAHRRRKKRKIISHDKNLAKNLKRGLPKKNGKKSV